MYYTDIISKLPTYVLYRYNIQATYMYYTNIISLLPKYANGYRSMLIKYVYSVLGFPANEKMRKMKKFSLSFSRSFVFFAKMKEAKNAKTKRNFAKKNSQRIFSRTYFFHDWC